MFENLILHNIVKALGWTIIHSIWQGGILTVVFIFLLIILRNYSTKVKYLVSVTVIFLFLINSILTFNRVYSRDSYEGKAEITITELTHENNTIKNIKEKESISLSMNNNVIFKQKVINQITKLEAHINRFISLIVIIWLFGFTILLFKSLSGLVFTEFFRKNKLHQPSARWQQRIAEFSKKLNIKRKVNIFFSPIVKSPIIFGHFKPVIYFPVRIITGLDDKEIEAVIIHELIHVLRMDYLVNVFQYLIESIFFYHPSIWWISSKIRTQREMICDEMTIDYTNESRYYINTLLKLEEQRISSSMPVLAAKSNNNVLFTRIKRILNIPENKRRIVNPYILIGMILLISCLIIFTSFISEHHRHSQNNNPESIQASIYNHDIKPEISYFTDKRDGQQYKIIKIKNTWWMAENLNYKISEGSWMYDNNWSKARKWGRLYTWEAAIKACPEGWHVATDKEWQELEEFLGIASDELNKLGWRNSKLGKYFRDPDYINIINGGYRPYGDGEFDDGGDDAYFWTSTTYDKRDAWKRYFSGSNPGRGFDDKRKGFSVRCVKD